MGKDTQAKMGLCTKGIAKVTHFCTLTPTLGIARSPPYRRAIRATSLGSQEGACLGELLRTFLQGAFLRLSSSPELRRMYLSIHSSREPIMSCRGIARRRKVEAEVYKHIGHSVATICTSLA
jgi:hypothetical protein